MKQRHSGHDWAETYMGRVLSHCLDRGWRRPMECAGPVAAAAGNLKAKCLQASLGSSHQTGCLSLCPTGDH